MLSYVSVNDLYVYILITRVEPGYNVIGLCDIPSIPFDFCGANYNVIGLCNSPSIPSISVVPIISSILTVIL